METRVQRWGHSLALRIPKLLADEAGLTDNSPVQLALRDKLLVIVPIRKPAISLDAFWPKSRPTTCTARCRPARLSGAKHGSGAGLRATTGRCGLADLQSPSGT